MERNEMRSMAGRLVAEARALRAAFPDTAAMGELPVSAFPAASADPDEEPGDRRAALGYLRDEMLVVRGGRAADLTVLDDEMANVERLLASD